MAATVSNFTINSGLLNEFIITIKKNKSLLPIEIDNTDTFKLYLKNRDTGIVEHELDNTNLDNLKGKIEIFNNANGQIKIIMNPVMTSLLKKEFGPKEDRYYSKPSYSISLECTTIDNGHFVSKIKNVYID